MSQTIVIRHAAQLLTMAGHTEQPATRLEMNELHVIENGSIIIQDGTILAVGTDEEIERKYKTLLTTAKKINATNKVVAPGLIDPHTHLVHAGTRENEYAMRLKGKSYMDIMNAGGGIHATTRATQQADFAMLYDQSKQRMDTFLCNGVTTIEAKSGYGLTLKDEIKQLEVAKQLNEDHPLDVVSTFMGAHAIPLDEKDAPEEFVDQIITEMIPEVAKKNLASFNDVFCERGVVTPEQSKRILEAGKEHGLTPKIHADEIEPYGGAELAAEVGAVSADHLLKTSDEGIKKLAENNVIGVLLPGTASFLIPSSDV